MSATPSARRQTTTTTTDIQLPPYQPPLAPLIPTYQQKLTGLAKSTTLKHLHTHIQHAADKLTDSAGDVNERLVEVREKALRSRKRNRAQFEGGQEQDGGENQGGDGEEEQRLQETEEEVKTVTAKLEEGIRRIVDAEVSVHGLSGVLTDLGKVAEQDAAAASTSTSSPRRTRRRRNPEAEDSDNDNENDDETPSQSQPQPQNNLPPTPYTKTLAQKLKTEASNWSNQSLTQRYSTNNTYIGFYRMVHDAKHPGNDIPPLPHASTWFRHLEGTGHGTPGDGSESDNDGDDDCTHQPLKREAEDEDENENENEEDLEIASERISLKCPLTLLTFQEPLTSTKCPHSFEKHAILDMISHSSTMVPPPEGSGGRNRVRAVKCPVCTILLTAGDLRKDPVLVRRVRRMQAMEEEEEDDDEDGGGGRRRSRGMRKSGITVGSDEDDEEEGDDEEEEEASEEEQPVRIKREKTAPNGE